ncbi:MAG: flagellar biosynthesis protein FlhF [Desulfitobacteriaceae bacterium]
MRVKRFVGENVAETMGKIKRELGVDAVILQTRQFREGGIFGLFGKMKVEITAAIEDRAILKSSSPLPISMTNRPIEPINKGNSDGSGTMVSWRNQDLDSIISSGLTAGSKGAGNSGSQGSNPEAGPVQPVQRELHQMQQLLEDMNKKMGNLGTEYSFWPPPLQNWAGGLRERGVTESLVKRLLRQVQQTVPEDQWLDQALVWRNLKESVRRICGQTAAIQPGVQKPRVVALVGPTGVGKTTTIGKLAAGFSIVDKRKVALITADTYRVAAVEQLKTFGEIIGVPVEVVMTPAGLREALLRHTDKELIFIDTAGRSPQHELHMSELRAFLDRAEPDLTMLVMSATTSSVDQLRVFKRFEPLSTHLIFTKLDETVSSGTLLNILDKTTLPVAYLTTGQNVPDDIEVATPERLADYVLGEEKAYA